MSKMKTREEMLNDGLSKAAIDSIMEFRRLSSFIDATQKQRVDTLKMQDNDEWTVVEHDRTPISEDKNGDPIYGFRPDGTPIYY